MRSILQISNKLDNKDTKFYYLNLILLSLLYFNVLVTPYLFGKIADEFIASSLKINNSIIFYSFLLGIIHFTVAFIRLNTKERTKMFCLNIAHKIRVFGFENLANKFANQEIKSTDDKNIYFTRISEGSKSFEALLMLFSSDIMPIIISLVGILATFIFVDFKLCLLIFSYFSIFLFIQIKFYRKEKKLQNEAFKSNEISSSSFIQGANSLLAVQASNSNTTFLGNLRKKDLEQTMKVKLAVNNTFTKWRYLQFTTALTAICFSLLCAVNVEAKIITPGQLVTYFTYFYKLSEFLGDGASIFDTILVNFISVQRLSPLILEEVVIKEGNETLKTWENFKISNINISYERDQNLELIFDNLSWQFKLGDKHCLFGPSGSGKSSLLRSIAQIQKLNSGNFYLDNINSNSFTLSSLRHNFVYVPQEVELFNISFLENICLFRPVDYNYLEEIIKTCELAPILEKLPQGLETILGDKALSLSGGERQRISIARALYGKPTTLLMDEATSALDPITEDKILQRLCSADNNLTIILATHKSSSLKYFKEENCWEVINKQVIRKVS